MEIALEYKKTLKEVKGSNCKIFKEAQFKSPQ